jgi:Zn-dependent protease with chaperone function
MRIAAISACLCLILTCAASAQSAPAPQQPQTSAGQTVTHYTLPPDKLAKSKTLYTTQVVLMIVETIYGFLVLLFLVRGRIGSRFRNWAESVTRFRFVQAFLVVPPILFILSALNLPFDVYAHKTYLEYGISVQGWLSWFWDWAKGELVQFVLFSPVIWLLYLIIRRSPRRWWFYFWLASIPIVVFVTFLAPVVLDPIFNKFEPLQNTNPALVQAIQGVTKRGGLDIPPERMYEMKASEKVTDYNAYVTGMGATKRVVVWDTTEHDMTTPEILFVFGHEMGHYVLGHIWKGILFLSAMLFIAFYVGYRIAIAAVSRWGGRLGIREIGDWASLPLLLLIFTGLAFLGTPIGSTFSRHIEHQADVYGLEVIHGLVPNSSQVAAEAFQKLGEKSFDYPYPNQFLVFWSYNHPAIPDRLLFSLAYRPWDEGKPTQYVK